MPLFKRKPFILEAPPQNLKSDEIVFQVRFTKEIFRDYQQYLKRINLYRQRVWTCKVTGKTNLTFEEALVSERKATEKIQHFPKELLVPVLHMVQYSTLSLKDLANTISATLLEHFWEGIEFYGRKDHFLGPCKVLKVVEKYGENTSYEVGWLDKYKKVASTSIINADDLIRKKLPFSQNVLKSFIRESTSQSAPWVLCDKLARKYGISTEPPEELRGEYFFCDGKSARNLLCKNHWASQLGLGAVKQTNYKKKRKRVEREADDGVETMMKKLKKEANIKYPIDDLLVQPGTDDPLFTDRPSPTNDFLVPMECVGDLLMVWDFCISFGKLLHLWPFSVEDFENALCHKNSNLSLIVEIHTAILRLLLKDQGQYFWTVQNKRRKTKVTAVNWGDFLCDFLEADNVPELSSHIGTIRRGHYGLLDVRAKLGILLEMVKETLMSQAIRLQLDEYIGQLQTLASTKREEAQEVAVKRIKEKPPADQAGADSNGLYGGNTFDNGRTDPNLLKACKQEENGNVQNKGILKVYRSRRKLAKEQGERNHEAFISKMMDAKVAPEDLAESTIVDLYKKQGKRKKKKQEQGKNTKQKKEQLEQEMEMQSVQTNPLGKDKNYNRYWFFRCDGRIFVESSDSTLWGYYTTKKELNLLMGSLNPKGERERALHKQLEKHYIRICKALEKRSKNTAAVEEAELRRSERVRSQPKGSNRQAPFLRYVNKWKED